jgi:hypothetical protein
MSLEPQVTDYTHIENLGRKNTWQSNNINSDTHEFKCKFQKTHYSSVLLDYGKKLTRIDVNKIIPKAWDLPEEFFEFVVPSSDNPTIVFCETLVRKANIMNENFRSYRQPAYMRSRSTSLQSIEKLPNIMDSKR